MARWDPWRGCHRYSEGCKFCYIHKGDARRGVDTNLVTKVGSSAGRAPFLQALVLQDEPRLSSLQPKPFALTTASCSWAVC